MHACMHPSLWIYACCCTLLPGAGWALGTFLYLQPVESLVVYPVKDVFNGSGDSSDSSGDSSDSSGDYADSRDSDSIIQVDFFPA